MMPVTSTDQRLSRSWSSAGMRSRRAITATGIGTAKPATRSTVPGVATSRSTTSAAMGSTIVRHDVDLAGPEQPPHQPALTGVVGRIDREQRSIVTAVEVRDGRRREAARGAEPRQPRRRSGRPRPDLSASGSTPHPAGAGPCRCRPCRGRRAHRGRRWGRRHPARAGARSARRGSAGRAGPGRRGSTRCPSARCPSASRAPPGGQLALGAAGRLRVRLGLAVTSASRRVTSSSSCTSSRHRSRTCHRSGTSSRHETSPKSSMSR